MYAIVWDEKHASLPEDVKDKISQQMKISIKFQLYLFPFMFILVKIRRNSFFKILKLSSKGVSIRFSSSLHAHCTGLRRCRPFHMDEFCHGHMEHPSLASYSSSFCLQSASGNRLRIPPIWPVENAVYFLESSSISI